MLNDASDNVITNTAIHDLNQKIESLTNDLIVLKNKLHDSVSNKVLKNSLFFLLLLFFRK